MKEQSMPSHKTSISMDIVNILMQYATSQDIALTHQEMAPCAPENRGARMSVKQLSTIWSEIVRRSGDQNFGLHLGEATDKLTSGGILFSVMMNCATVEKALEKLARYHNLATDFVQLHLNRQKEYAHYIWKPVDFTIPLDRHYTETVFCGLVFPLRRLTQGKVQPTEIRFTHAHPKDISEHQRIFGCPMVFDCPQNELILRYKDLAQPIFQANEQLLDRLEQFAQEMLEQLYPPDAWTDKAVHLINKSLARGEKTTLNVIAGELALSPRQLQNKLKEEGITYQKLLDQVRKEIAIKYLDDPRITVCEIAFLLGFSEQSAFNHAFKRWMGTAPGDYRRSESSPA